MDKTAIAKELSRNKLDLSTQGTVGIPAELIRIGDYSIGGPDNEDLGVTVWAFTQKRGGPEQTYCSAFMVKIDNSLTYYYRDLLFEVDNLVAALRAHHGYKPIR